MVWLAIVNDLKVTKCFVGGSSSVAALRYQIWAILGPSNWYSSNGIHWGDAKANKSWSVVLLFCFACTSHLLAGWEPIIAIWRLRKPAYPLLSARGLESRNYEVHWLQLKHRRSLGAECCIDWAVVKLIGIKYCSKPFLMWISALVPLFATL